MLSTSTRASSASSFLSGKNSAAKACPWKDSTSLRVSQVLKRLWRLSVVSKLPVVQAQITAANSDFPAILQWSSVHAGGHHSYEDIHQLILQTYASICQQSNIALIAALFRNFL
jgi:hypothetical protein